MRIKLRKASIEDANFCYELRNEISSRKNSFDKKKIRLNDHLGWFNSKLKDKNIIFLIGYINKITSIGIVRYEIKNKVAEVSINVHKKFRNLGYALKILKKSEKYLKKKTVIISKIKKFNKKSLKIFKKNNYKMINQDQILILIKVI